uniref:Cellular inhibitor of PP2A n=1 Tax=Oryzias latipes TaxID=8090 RepID=H2LD82_ORYLA
MDTTTCLKSLLLAIQQYRDGRTAQQAAQLQKQEVWGLKCEQLLTSGSALTSECVSMLVELTANPHTEPSLKSSIISLLAQLSDNSTRELLHSSYNLTSTLAAVIHCYSSTPGEPLVLQQCLQVLQKLTYNTRVFQSNSCIHQLLEFLMTSQSHSDDIILPCLGLMANLCRDNPSVQTHIKSLDNVKPFYRTLINFLAHNSLTVVVFTLSILASLTLNEKVGEKQLFDAKNIHQTFQLVFNIIVNGDGTLTRKYAVDLLVDLLRNPKIAEHLTYQHFSACVTQVLGLLHSKDADSATKALSFVEMLLPVLLGLLKSLDPAQGDAVLRKHCQRVTHVTNLLLQVCAEALLKTLELMSKLRQQVKDMETGFYRMLQDQRIVTPLSLALTSHHREHVQTALALLLEATPLPDFPSMLGESIAAHNAYRHREAELSIKRLAVQEVPPPRVNSSMDTSSSSKTISSLAEKIQSGLELQEQMKDSHVSDIIEVYEQKLAAFASKEGRLQDLLEAKALALSQADRLIAQYRLQRAQAEAELQARKLASLLKDAERRREDLQGKLSCQALEVERSKADMGELLQHNSRLQRDSEEHQALKGAYNSLLNFNETEQLLKELQTAHILLTKQSDSLKKTHDALQLQHHLQAEEEKVQEKETERRNLEETLDILRKELNKTEQARKDASIKASSLELQKSQLESKLKLREEELNKHSAMIAMIHSLSSGKMKSDV